MTDDALQLAEENRQLKNQLVLTKGISDRIIENLVDVEILKSQLETMRAARDAACDELERIDSPQVHAVTISRLRAVGDEP